jgi:hypothetical protein
VKLPRLLFLLVKSIMLAVLLRILLTLKNLKSKIKNRREKNRMEKKKAKKKKGLPDFPPENLRPRIQEAEEEEKKETKGSGPGTSEDENGNIQEICRDLIAVPFEVWAILRPGVEPLSDPEKTAISKPLARIVIKYDVARYLKDEFLLLAFLGYSVVKRLKVPKSADKITDNSGKEGQGKDDPSKIADSPTA